MKNTIDTDASLSKVETMPTGGSYASRAENFAYTSAGAVSAMKLGNNKWENAQFNSRLQPTQLGLGTSATDQSLWKVNYDYGTTDNNGNVKSQTIAAPSINALAQTYTYDSLNRLKSATETQNSSQTWKQTFTYDRFGNRNFDSANTTTIPAGCSAAQCNPQIDAANNRFTTGQGYTYDLSGNLITDAQNRSFTYDAENKQKEVKDSSNSSIGTYFYDGDGKRVKKISAAETTVFVYDAPGKLAAEYLLTSATPQTPQTSYLTTDTLGSPRVITDQSGNVISRRDFMPFGEEIANLGNRTAADGYQADATRQKFTGYERDAESGLDFAQARYFGSSYGRFTSPFVEAKRVSLFLCLSGLFTGFAVDKSESFVGWYEMTCRQLRTVCQRLRFICRLVRTGCWWGRTSCRRGRNLCRSVRICCRLVETVCRLVRIVCRRVGSICRLVRISCRRVGNGCRWRSAGGGYVCF